MADEVKATEPIVVSENANVLDTAAAAFRYAVVIAGVIPTLLTLVGQHDVVGIIAWFQGSEGAKLFGAAAALIALGWGLWKTHFRGAQIVTVAADRRVPDSVAKIAK